MKTSHATLVGLLSALVSAYPGCVFADGAGNQKLVDDFNAAYNAFSAHIDAGAYSKALPEARRALELGTVYFGEEARETAHLTYNYGTLLYKSKDDESAQEFLALALQRYENIFGEGAMELVPVLTDLGRVYAGTSDSRRAVRYLRRGLEIERAQQGEDSESYARALTKAGVILLNAGEPRLARRFLKGGYDVAHEVFGAADAQTGYAAFQLGRLTMAESDNSKAKTYFLEALETFENPDAPSNQLELTTHAFLVRVYEDLGKSDLATRHCLAIGKMTPFSEDQDYVPLYKSPPDYPASALMQGKEGEVIVSFTVDANGFVRDPEIVSSDGGRVFEKPALEAVGQFRYAPRYADGKPVSTTGVQNKIIFRVED